MDIAGRAAEIEQARSLPRDIVDHLIETGVFRLCVPKAIGGLEAEPSELVERIAAIAEADGSTGWCAMIGATSGLAAAYLPQAAASAIYGPRTVAGGVFAPRGRAVAAEGGFRISGRWAFASGCRHCDWLMVGALVEREVRLFLLPAGEIAIHDTWQVAGLAGTGSNDIEVADRFVPVEHSFSLSSGRPWAAGRLYAFPAFGLLALGIAAVAVGIASGAIADFRAIATKRTPTLGRRALAERGQIQAVLAEATAEVEAARAYLHRAIGQAEAPLSLEARARVRLAATHATRTAAEAVTKLHQHAGGGSLYLDSPLQRRFRDIHAATQHMMVGPATLELVGRLQFGLDTDTAML